jgi:hypothetical protein
MRQQLHQARKFYALGDEVTALALAYEVFCASKRGSPDYRRAAALMSLCLGGGAS